MARCAGSQPGMGSCQVNFVRVFRILSPHAPECAPVGGSPEIKGLFSGFAPFPEDILQRSLELLSRCLGRDWVAMWYQVYVYAE